MKKTTAKKMKVVGSRSYTDESTGEVKQFQVIEMQDQDFNFEKLWLAHILSALEAVGNQKIKVMNTLLELKNTDNLIAYSQQEIAEQANVSRSVVNECQATFKNDHLRQIKMTSLV